MATIPALMVIIRWHEISGKLCVVVRAVSLRHLSSPSYANLPDPIPSVKRCWQGLAFVSPAPISFEQRFFMPTRLDCNAACWTGSCDTGVAEAHCPQTKWRRF